jgi:hypothetical protein
MAAFDYDAVTQYAPALELRREILHHHLGRTRRTLGDKPESPPVSLIHRFDLFCNRTAW